MEVLLKMVREKRKLDDPPNVTYVLIQRKTEYNPTSCTEQQSVTVTVVTVNFQIFKLTLKLSYCNQYSKLTR